jgi:CspA family cold shock protein
MRIQQMIMNDGIVKWFNDAKGFGFIEMEDGREVFVHYSNLQVEGFKTVSEGQKVTFDLYEDKNGRPTALNVKRK